MQPLSIPPEIYPVYQNYGEGRSELSIQYKIKDNKKKIIQDIPQSGKQKDASA
jgi:hypothetical protein